MKEKEDIIIGNPKYRRFVEEERSRQLWEDEKKRQAGKPIDKGRILLSVLVIAGIGLGVINSYAIAMEVWERRNENQTVWINQQINLEQLQDLEKKLEIKK